MVPAAATARGEMRIRDPIRCGLSDPLAFALLNPHNPAMFEYQNHRRYFAQCARGLEALLAGELRELGAEPENPGHHGVGFLADAATLYRVAYGSRLAARVLAPLITFDCHSDRYLYATARKLDWNALLTPATTFAVDATVSESRIDHSQFAAQRLKDAIVDHFRETAGERPSVDRRTPQLQLNLHLRNDRAVISIDIGGGALHRRGYRTAGGNAPLQETLAAAIVRLSGWDGEDKLHDPMCGSGTLLAEAWLAASRIPPGWLRAEPTPPWAVLPDFDARTWDDVKREARARSRRLPGGLVTGADLDPAALATARANLDRLPAGVAIRLRTADARELALPPGATVLTNPPYGVRIGRQHEVDLLYKALGDALKRNCPGTTAWILCGDTTLVGKLGLRPGVRIPLWNGGIECRLVRLDLFAGPRERKPES
jgi:putative N6-adenine-specific DNA methylase